MIMAVMTAFPMAGQEVFRIDFENDFIPEGWQVGNDAEWARLLGDGGGNYFRFHPVSWKDELRSPALQLSEGHYVLYYSWNEAASGNPDFCDIRLRMNSRPWESIDRIGEGNDRNWQQDSTVLGSLDAGEYTLEFAYQSTVRYPSQYLNLDNIYLVRSEVVTGIEELSLNVAEVFPNPASDIIQFRLNDPLQRNFQIRIINELGQLAGAIDPEDASSTSAIDISSLPQGIYVVEWSLENVRFTKRFLIQR